MRNKIHLWRRADGGITMIVPAWDDLKNGYDVRAAREAVTLNVLLLGRSRAANNVDVAEDEAAREVAMAALSKIDASIAAIPTPQTEEDFYNHAMAVTLEKAPEKPAEVLGDVDAADLPYWGNQPNLGFRNALDWDGTKPVINMGKARGIKMAYVRKDRDARLETTDLEVLKLDGAAVPAPLKAKRQALRDMPATVQSDLAATTTVEELEAFEPTWP